MAPTPTVTVMVEPGDPYPEVHLHAGGQGVWVARMSARLGAEVALATVLGGETGRVLAAVLPLPGLEIHAVQAAGPNGCCVQDRRRGRRETIADMPSARLGRHEADELYGVALADGLSADVACLTGAQPAEAVEPEIYERLSRDLRRHGITVIADLTGPALRAALPAGIDVLKLSAGELVREGFASDERPETIAAAITALGASGAATVIASRGPDPAIVLLSGQIYELGGLRLTSVDPLGSGDSMLAGIAVACAEGRDLPDALRFGAAAGALNATRHGLGTGTRRETERLSELVSIGQATLEAAP